MVGWDINMQQSILNKSRKDKFKMVFQLPLALKKIDTIVNRSTNTIIEDSMQFSIYGTIIPQITVPALDIRYSGSTLYNSSHSKNPYPPTTVKFTVDSGYNNYWVIYKWLDLLHNEKTGVFDQQNLIDGNIFTQYQTDITIYGVDEFNNNKIKFVYKQAFPTDIGAIDYDYRNSNEIESSFTFVYSQLHVTLLD